MIGAAARVLIIDGQHGHGSGRVTLNVDFAIYVLEWKEYDVLLEKLLSLRIFTPTKMRHKLMYKESKEIADQKNGAII